ncbi:MAG: hypothetical protein KF884_07740 [Fimbriimonadaceae bacterium]|nr:hypothetical protein [Fimbriimonadaceae bacterium]QYK57442.1 MAG: hypothetical protein KF884_07740 [Fimbriimonadaceae bacterium]
MRVLVLGGTQFVGRWFVQAALDKGHQVTLFHRGQTGPGLFPQAEHVLGDRLESLAPLAGREWDALVDVSAYVPRAVRMAADALKDRVGHCLQVSTVSVYRPQPGPVDEQSPLATLDDPTTETIDAVTYGGLKALCEDAARRAFPSLSVVRPTIVVGPHDHTERFDRWVGRLGRNETVTVPVRDDGTAGPFQWIDARDLAAFMLSLVESQRAGTWNGAAPWIPFLEAIERMKAALGSSSEVRTVAEAPDRDRDPLVLPPDGAFDALKQVSCQAALAAGLTPRPLEDSTRDTWAWMTGAAETIGQRA